MLAHDSRPILGINGDRDLFCPAAGGLKTVNMFGGPHRRFVFLGPQYGTGEPCAAQRCVTLCTGVLHLTALWWCGMVRGPQALCTCSWGQKYGTGEWLQAVAYRRLPFVLVLLELCSQAKCSACAARSRLR